jgi:hypothetical protein
MIYWYWNVVTRSQLMNALINYNDLDKKTYHYCPPIFITLHLLITSSSLSAMKGDDHVFSALSEGTARFNHVINMISCYGKNLFLYE